jgi:hypothetical protein
MTGDTTDERGRLDRRAERDTIHRVLKMEAGTGPAPETYGERTI